MAIAACLATAALAQSQPAPEKRRTAPRELPPQVMGTELFSTSPWMKLCGRDKSDPAAPQVCLTLMEVRREVGPFAAGVALIEGAGHKTILRVTLPPDVRRAAGARIAVDRDAPRDGTFLACNPQGCLADFEIDAPFIAKLRSGTQLRLGGVHASGVAANYRLPLEDLAKVLDGPPTDPATYQREQKRWRDDSCADSRSIDATSSVQARANGARAELFWGGKGFWLPGERPYASPARPNCQT